MKALALIFMSIIIILAWIIAYAVNVRRNDEVSLVLFLLTSILTVVYLYVISIGCMF